MSYLGDYPEDFTTVAIYFSSYDNKGAPVAPSSAFVASDVKIYKNGSATEKTSTNGLTMTSPFDSITGLHRLLLDTSNDTGDVGFWVAGATYSVILSSSKTVQGQPVLREIGTFGICLGPALRPTTAGRTLDVSAGGEAGLDWANVGSPTTTLNLSGTTVKTSTDVETATQDIQSRLPAALVSGRIDASIGAVASGVIAAASFASGALDAVWSTASRLLTAGTNIVLAKGAGITGFNDLSAAQVNAEADTALADVGVTATVTGRIDAAISTRLASASYAAPLDASGTRAAIGLASANLDSQLAAIDSDVVSGASTIALGVAAVKAQTDQLSFTVANQVDANMHYVNDTQITGAGTSGDPWGP